MAACRFSEVVFVLIFVVVVVVVVVILLFLFHILGVSFSFCFKKNVFSVYVQTHESFKRMLFIYLS